MQKRKPTKIESRLFVLLAYYETNAGAYLARKLGAYHDAITSDLEGLAARYRPETLPLRRKAERERKT